MALISGRESVKGGNHREIKFLVVYKYVIWCELTSFGISNFALPSSKFRQETLVNSSNEISLDAMKSTNDASGTRSMHTTS